MTAPVVGAVVERIAPLYGLRPISDDAIEAQNPLVAMVADYDSVASKKPHSLVMEVKAAADELNAAAGKKKRKG